MFGKGEFQYDIFMSVPRLDPDGTPNNAIPR
jgi:hypothetical protein